VTYLTLCVLGHPLPVQACPVTPSVPYRLKKGQAYLRPSVGMGSSDRNCTGEDSRPVWDLSGCFERLMNNSTWEELQNMFLTV
jgi:hypothetical protein